MDVLRTPDERFANLSGYSFDPNYIEVAAEDGTPIRIHYLDQGPKDGEPILCMHGQPSWSFLYRKMIPLLTEAGYRVIAPDLVGFGRSDKPASDDDYTYRSHVDWMSQWLRALDMKDLTLVCQDWGGLIGLRVAADHLGLFKRVVVANTGLPASDRITDEVSAMLGEFEKTVPVPTVDMVREQMGSGAPGGFLYWVKYCKASPDFSVRDVFGMMSGIEDEAVLDGYEAPFPDASYMAGARQFPSLVPLLPRHKQDREDNDAAWAKLETFDGPVLTAFSNNDPVTAGGAVPFQERLKGAKGRDHPTIDGGGHFLQEGAAAPLSEAIIKFVAETA